METRNLKSNRKHPPSSSQKQKQTQHPTNYITCSILEAFIIFVKDIVKQNRNKYAHFISVFSKNEVYPKMGSLSTVLGLNDKQMEFILVAAGLGRLEKGGRSRFCLLPEVWDSIAVQAPGFIFDFRCGAQKEHKLIALGGKKESSITELLSQKLEAPSKEERWFGTCLEKFRSNISVKKVLSQLLVDDQSSSYTSPVHNEEDIDTTSSNTGTEVATTTTQQEPAKQSQKTKKRKQKNERQMRETEIGGVTAIMTNGYKGIHKNTLSAFQEASRMKTTMLAEAKKKRSDLSELDKLFVGTLASRFPQASDVVAEQMICGGGILCGSKLQLFKGVDTDRSLIDFDCFHQILPSRTTIATAVTHVAAHKIIHQGLQMLKAKTIFIGCDKGGGVLIKLAFYYAKAEKRMQSVNLDFDKADDDAAGGGIAIKHSVSKYTFPNKGAENIGIKFDGGGSDSGGGFTGTAMFNELKAVNLVKDPSKWIHLACTSHNDQTNLRVAMEAAYGFGGLDARTVPQLLHSFAYVQKQLGGALETKPLLQTTWNLVRGADEPIPKRVLKLMPEPILTRWGTVGEASCWIDDFGDVSDLFCKGICGATWSKAAHSIHQGASNFRSLFKEPEIVLGNSFVADFDRKFFRQHLDFNHSTDPHIGMSGFLSHHHLVRYFLKDQELAILIKEVDDAISTSTGLELPASNQAILCTFWQKLQDSTVSKETKTSVVRTAAAFLREYQVSLKKHNEQWLSHIILGCFGEAETAQTVARHILGTDNINVVERLQYFQSPIHNKKIDVFAFTAWLKRLCPKEKMDAVTKTPNFDTAKEAIEDIAEHGWDIWNDHQNLLATSHKDMFLEEFAANPSTMEIVERAVKKAKLCQQTGKGERSVTAYGIAGDSVSELCPHQYVSSTYVIEMSKKRRVSQEKAQEEGRITRSKEDYEIDIERGPGLTINLYNHTLECLNNANIARDEIGYDVYKARLEKTVTMLAALENNSSFLRYSRRRDGFEAAMKLTDSEYKPSTREQEEGVSVTPLMRGEVPLGKLLKKDNHHLIFQECIAWGLVLSVEGMKMPLFSDLGKLIKENEKSTWIAANPGKAVPDTVGKTFKPISGAKFVVNNK